MILEKESNTVIINGHNLTTEILNRAGGNDKSRVKVSEESKKKLKILGDCWIDS